MRELQKRNTEQIEKGRMEIRPCVLEISRIKVEVYTVPTSKLKLQNLVSSPWTNRDKPQGTFWFSHEQCTFYTNKYMAILKS